MLPPALDRAGLGDVWSWTIDIVRLPLLLVVVALALALVYRFGPNRRNEPRRWITFGSGAAALLWLSSSLLFEWAVGSFGSLDVLYGALSAAIAFMMWIWLSTVVALFGAELDAATERTLDPSPRSEPRRTSIAHSANRR